MSVAEGDVSQGGSQRPDCCAGDWGWAGTGVSTWAGVCQCRGVRAGGHRPDRGRGWQGEGRRVRGAQGWGEDGARSQLRDPGRGAGLLTVVWAWLSRLPGAAVLTASCQRTAGWDGPSLRSPRRGRCVSVGSGRVTSCCPPRLRLLRSGLPWQVSPGLAGGDGPTRVWVVDRPWRRWDRLGRRSRPCRRPRRIPAATQGRDVAEMLALPVRVFLISFSEASLPFSACRESVLTLTAAGDHPSLILGHVCHPRRRAGAH